MIKFLATNLISKGPSYVTLTRLYWCSQHVEFNLICLKQLTFRLLSKGRIGMLEQIIRSGIRKESIERGRISKGYGWILGILWQHFALVCFTYPGRFAPSGLVVSTKPGLLTKSTCATREVKLIAGVEDVNVGYTWPSEGAFQSTPHQPAAVENVCVIHSSPAEWFSSMCIDIGHTWMHLEIW